MAIKIGKIEEKPLLARKEISGHMRFEGKATPSNDDVKKAIASELKVDANTIVVKHIYTAFGSSEADIEAYVYNKEEDLKLIEPKQKKKEEKKPDEEAKEEAKPEPVPPAQEKKEEKPEEKKEEAKEEKEKAVEKEKPKVEEKEPKK